METRAFKIGDRVWFENPNHGREAGTITSADGERHGENTYGIETATGSWWGYEDQIEKR